MSVLLVARMRTPGLYHWQLLQAVLLAVAGGDPEPFFHLASVMVGHLEVWQNFFIKLVNLFRNLLCAPGAHNFVLLGFVVDHFACARVKLV